MINRIPRLAAVFLILLLAAVFFAGCAKPEKKPQLERPQKQESDTQKEPKELPKLIKEIEAVIKALEKKQESAPQKTLSPEAWKSEKNSVEEIHKMWTVVEVEAVKAGADDRLRRDFENNLNALTKDIIDKSILKSLESANELYGSAVEIAGLFKTNNPPQADMLKYYTQKVLFAGEADNWEMVQGSVINLKKQWEKVKTLLEDNKTKLIPQMDYAVMDLTDAAAEQNINVMKIKADIVLSYTEQIIKEIEKQKKQQ